MDTSSEALSSNITKGDREKLNKCNLCDYASGQAGKLRTHMNKHYGEKSYKCSQCDFATVYASNFKTH